MKKKLSSKMNADAFKALIEKYESITLEELQEAGEGHDHEYIYRKKYMHRSLEDITGFGNSHKCTLCFARANQCEDCVWTTDACSSLEYIGYACVNDTYDDISDAGSFEDLLITIKARVKYMREFLKENYEE